MNIDNFSKLLRENSEDRMKKRRTFYSLKFSVVQFIVNQSVCAGLKP